jgi:hypothetical protein
MTTRLFVQIVSAPWCKRCVEIKPRVAELCRIVGATFEEVNFDELEDDDSLKASITALPTVRLLIERDGRPGAWTAYTPKELSVWEEQMRLHVSVAPSGDMDF